MRLEAKMNETFNERYTLMHSGLNSLRDHLWFNRFKDTETWS